MEILRLAIKTLQQDLSSFRVKLINYILLKKKKKKKKLKTNNCIDCSFLTTRFVS